MSQAQVLQRKDQKPEDCWDLKDLYQDAAGWEADFARLPSLVDALSGFKGRLGEGAATILACLKADVELGLLAERLGHFAFLRLSEDAGDAERQNLQNRFMALAVKVGAARSFMVPELQSLPMATLEAHLKDPLLADFAIVLNKMVRLKPHILPQDQEELLAWQSETAQTARQTFSALVDVDFDFGTIATAEGPVALSHASFGALVQSPDRAVRQAAWTQYHQKFVQYRNTIANLYAGSIRQDVFEARVRHYPSSLDAALFPDKVDPSVYRNLIATVRSRLPGLHRYYAIRTKALKLPKLALWDTKASLIPGLTVKHSFDEAAQVVLDSLSPLGTDYTAVLARGLRGGWVDRYENKGKRSGAFSAGAYTGQPYILMNFQDELLRDVFTLAHEAGHSMHSYYSVKNNPFQHYDYTIFEAEVASTTNEQLLFEYLVKKNAGTPLEAYLINKQVDDIIATLYRQTMFAEFELICHEIVESGDSLSTDRLRQEYRSLLGAYFGPGVDIAEEADIEGLRIPHFYRAFYVYKYATGLAAAMSLAQGLLSGRPEALRNYSGFLKAGGSRYPIDNLRLAGVDMEQPAPINAALDVFDGLVDQLAKHLG